MRASRRRKQTRSYGRRVGRVGTPERPEDPAPGDLLGLDLPRRLARPRARLPHPAPTHRLDRPGADLNPVVVVHEPAVLIEPPQGAAGRAEAVRHGPTIFSTESVGIAAGRLHSVACGT